MSVRDISTKPIQRALHRSSRTRASQRSCQGAACTVLPPDLGRSHGRLHPCDTPASAQPERCGRSFDYRVRQTWIQILASWAHITEPQLPHSGEANGALERMSAWPGVPHSPTSPGHLGAPRPLGSARKVGLLGRC